MKMKDVAPLIQKELEVLRERCARAAEFVRDNQSDEVFVDLMGEDSLEHSEQIQMQLLDKGGYCEFHCNRIAAAIRALSVEVTIVRPETAATKELPPHAIIAGQGLHPETEAIIDRKRMASTNGWADGLENKFGQPPCP